MTLHEMLHEWWQRRKLQLQDIRHGHRPRRYAFRLRDIRAAFKGEYEPRTYL